MTERRLEVLGLMAEGLSAYQVGTRLGITVDTVKTLQRGIYQALHARTAAHAIALGFEQGMLVVEPSAPPSLSQRELQVVALLARGHARRAIGAQLYISPHTVKKHLERIRRRMSANTSAQVVAICAGTGLLS